MRITENRLTKAISKLESLVNQYDEQTWLPSLESETGDILAKLNAINIPKQLSLGSLMSASLNKSITKGQRITESIQEVINEMSSAGFEKSSLHRYFDDIKHVYDSHGNNYNIEYCPENKNKLIEMNLKTVISIAKRYQNMGVDLEDLISAGNVGLCIAWDKFNPEKSKFRNQCLEVIEHFHFPCNYVEMRELFVPIFEYGDFLEKLDNEFEGQLTIEKKNVMKWINKNIPEIKFSSVASMWIRAYILSEIDNYSRIIRKPKSEIYKDKQDTGSYKKEQPVYIDVQDQNIELPDMTEEVPDAKSNQIILAQQFAKLFDGMDNKTRSIVLRKVGIGLPRPMTPQEIADFEGITTARVSQLFQQGLKRLRTNAEKNGITHRQLSALISG